MKLFYLTLGLLFFASGAAAREVTDAAGRHVRLEDAATRIVALAPHIVENLFSAGAGDKIVGVVNYSDYPAAAQQIPQLGSAYAWSLEALVDLEPDLVIMWGSGNGLATLPQLERLGYTVYVSEPRKLDDIASSIRDFGVLAGTEQKAERAASNLDHQLAELSERYAGAAPLDVFYQIWDNPLQTVNGEHMISAVISLCGGRNAFAEAAQLAPQISLEAVLLRDPDAIVASGMGDYRPQWLDMWKSYPQLKAVKQHALLHVHPDLIQRPTARIAQGAEELCRQLAQVRKAS